MLIFEYTNNHFKYKKYDHMNYNTKIIRMNTMKIYLYEIRLINNNLVL